MLEIALLGPPEVLVDGEPLAVDTRKAVALLAYLAVSGRPQAREQVAALLWPDQDDAHSRSALRRTLSTLRTGLGGRWVATSGDAVALEGDDRRLDLAELRSLVASCAEHGHERSETCRDCVDPLRRAAALARGGFMDGFTLRDSPEFDDWQRFEAEGIAREVAQALERLVEACAGAGLAGEAVEQARRLLSLDPLREPVHRRLMSLYARPATARRRWSSTGSASASWNGSSGWPRSRRRRSCTTRSSRAGARRRPSAPPPRPSRPEASASSPWSGGPTRSTRPGPRSGADWPTGICWWSRARAGSARRGWSTRPRRRSAPRSSRSGASRARPASRTRRWRAPCAPPRPRRPGPGTRWARSGATRRPGWCPTSRRPGPEPAPLDGPGAQTRFVEGVVRTLVGTLGRGGVLVVDDAQWADPSSIDLFTFLARRLPGNRAGARDDLARGGRRRRPPAADARPGGGPGRRGNRDRTPPAGVGGRPGAGGGVARWVRRRRRGAPVRGDGGRAVLPARVPRRGGERGGAVGRRGRHALDGARAPPGPRVLGGTGRAAGPVGRRGARGRTFSFGLVRVDERPERGGDPVGARGEPGPRPAHGGEARPRAPVRLRPRQAAGGRRGGHHAARRRLLHRRAAERLAAAGPGVAADATAGEAAEHFLRAGMEPEAAVWFERAGLAARAVFANREAAGHLLAALALGNPRQAGLHEDVGDLLTLLGDYGEALAHYEAAAAGAAARRPPPDRTPPGGAAPPARESSRWPTSTSGRPWTASATRRSGPGSWPAAA